MISFLSVVFLSFWGIFDRGNSSAWFNRIPDSVFTILKRVAGSVLIGVIGLIVLSQFVASPEYVTSEMKKMSEEELSEVTGAELLDFTIEQGQTNVSGSFSRDTCGWYCSNPYTYNYNIDNTDQHFVRLGLDARIEITGDDGSSLDGLRIDGLKAGHYDDSEHGVGSGDGGFITGTGDGSAGQSFYYGPHFNGHNGCVSCSNNDNSNSFDLDGDGLVFDVAGANAGGEQVVIEGPYVELAYDDFNGDPQLAGIRVGMEKIRGGAQIESINQISTTIRAQDFNNAGGFDGSASCAGHRMNDCSTTGGANALSFFGELAFGSNNGFSGDGDSWTEDFWISVNAQDMFWDHNNPAAGTSNASAAEFHTDGAGFWLHATDDVEGGL